mmetsp:Transcript_9704/g.27737  ORF Transcript_9704/g.27737 Transcript_9704/m.27737 type:complete len:550 (-) Transcript_9704:174-1823(-)|eukprot:CAMPEP_0117662060 /NCGR_PEP_ID=MMETSP0804-20121206/7859_1 /TAXON_ID=1074897 /ORGANISM="Tetraselmis astigmatica, Strain CCMP880" /LENGTH=549 /DNA_ID=CAMNT_0005468949 /DNA_START=573 /DNA_END=2222 /DNA_ORIENTATION=+
MQWGRRRAPRQVEDGSCTSTSASDELCFAAIGPPENSVGGWLNLPPIRAQYRSSVDLNRISAEFPSPSSTDSLLSECDDTESDSEALEAPARVCDEGPAPLCCTCKCDCIRSALEAVEPSHYELAAASYFAGVKSPRRRKAIVPSGTSLSEICAVEDNETGLRVVLFTGPKRPLPECGCPPCEACQACSEEGQQMQRRRPHSVAAAVLAFRGTRAMHRGNLAADYGILRHNSRRRELRIAEEARGVVEGFASQLAAGSPGVRYVWVVAGHSLGGFLATTIAIRMPELVQRCVAFESPGCPKLYRELAAVEAEEEEWRERITTYLTLPNPINTSHPHVGRIVRVELSDLLSAPSGSHLIKCVAGTAFRWMNWACLAVVAFLAVELLLGLSISVAVVRACDLLHVLAPPLLLGGSPLSSSLCLVGLGEAVTLVHLTSAASLSFKGTTALMATRLGLNLPFQLAAHKLSHILAAFSPATGLPKSAVEMASWPHSACLKRSVSRDLSIYLWESFFPCATTESVRHLFNRRCLINNRVALLPGYKEMPPTSSSS